MGYHPSVLPTERIVMTNVGKFQLGMAYADTPSTMVFAPMERDTTKECQSTEACVRPIYIRNRCKLHHDIAWYRGLQPFDLRFRQWHKPAVTPPKRNKRKTAKKAVD